MNWVGCVMLRCGAEISFVTANARLILKTVSGLAAVCDVHMILALPSAKYEYPCVDGRHLRPLRGQTPMFTD